MTIPPARIAEFAKPDPRPPLPAVLNALGLGMRIGADGAATFDVPPTHASESSPEVYINLLNAGIAGDFFDASGNPALLGANIQDNDFVSVSFAGDSALLYLSAVNMGLMTSLDLTGCVALTTLLISSADLGFTAIDLSDLISLHALELLGSVTSLDLSGNPNLNAALLSLPLTSLDISANPSLLNLTVQAFIADPADIDAILITLDNNGLSDGAVNLAADGNAAPGPDGLTAKASLEGKGWTVFVTAAPTIGAIDSFSLSSGGTVWFEGDTYTVQGGDGNAAGVVDTVTPPAQGPIPIIDVHQGSGEITITAVDQGTKTFTVTGDWTVVMYPGRPATAVTSTGNDGTYTVVSSVLDTGDTVITVAQPIPSAIADGVFFDFSIVTLPGDHTTITTPIQRISASTGNDGLWATSPGILVDGDTKFVFVGPYPAISVLPSAVADGEITSGGIMATTHLTDPGTGYSVANEINLIADVAQTGQDAQINITAIV